MTNDEKQLLYNALVYEEGHPRRTQHILKVYALSKMLGEMENINAKEQQVLNAAAILHDIPIKYCKEHYNGDACQENQRKEAPALVGSFLAEANYTPDYVSLILELVVKHHDYDCEKSKLLQLLIEADLIINCYESSTDVVSTKEIQNIFKTSAGKELLKCYLKCKM